ncbi:SAM-dependent methyltransferase [Kibdelosporangium aridum]|uniref:S-adenosyl methyltransferase n=1 Tax=Kibdelosporangium aridum TaxID=2030 RepID=A0A1W2FJU0_KIBAR|nr:SAM-dependent methyltransferase [Kibdelosporangium aridum]SMD22014.1 S-adenosyl methyltransferase [Kibdelosporangium aridum]
MTEQQTQNWIPDEVDTSVPSMARTYDFLLGGAHNFAVDRMVAEQAEKAMPGAAKIARINRAFLGRVVRFMVDQGVTQFLDIGSGIPTVGNVHVVAQQANPQARVLYVDKDPIAVAHSELMLGNNDRADVLRADMRDPESIVHSSQARRLLDFDKPIGMLLVMMIHWVPDEDDPWALIGRYRDALPTGSYLALSHVTAEQREDQVTEVQGKIRESRSTDQLTPRSHDQILRMFDGFELVEPGLVGCGLWHPRGPGDIADNPELNSHVYGGVGKKL